MLRIREKLQLDHDIRISLTIRTKVYSLLGNGKDALLTLMDAVLVTRSVYSFVELSVSPVFRRKWSSIYEAIETAYHHAKNGCSCTLHSGHKQSN
jgi:hypothetical protein